MQANQVSVHTEESFHSPQSWNSAQKDNTSCLELVLRHVAHTTCSSSQNTGRIYLHESLLHGLQGHKSKVRIGAELQN